MVILKPLYFILGKYDAGAAGTLSMRLRLPDEVNRLELKLEGPETNTQSVNLMAYRTDDDAAGWITFSVPLVEFSAIDLTQVVRIGLWNPSDGKGDFVSCEMVVDNIGFE